MTSTNPVLENTKKLRELVLYICRSSEDDEYFSATKLNKLLFYSDFACYLDLGEAITGQEYQKMQYGPVPRAMKVLEQDMLGQHEYAIYLKPFHGRTQKRPIALRAPDLSIFSGSQIAMVNEVLRRFRRMSASEISENSHRFTGWQLAQDGEIIPYAAALLDNRPVTEQEDKWADELDMTGVEEIFRAHGSRH